MDPDKVQGVWTPPPPEKSQNIEFLSSADDGPPVVIFGSSLPLNRKKIKKSELQSWTPSDKTSSLDPRMGPHWKEL